MSKEVDEEIICDPEPGQERAVKDLPLKISTSRNVESKILHNNANSTDSSVLMNVHQNSTKPEIKSQSQETDVSMCSKPDLNQKAEAVIKTDPNIVSPMEDATEQKNSPKHVIHKQRRPTRKSQMQLNNQCEQLWIQHPMER
ncbi:hypothetical protein GOP47_0028663 [Adiantum capillus-veneris]|nr:hypothetical protein GOP47_0028663 [Adiantum capillus-veneris]